ncbi:MAG: HPr family phosphocarrier protein [Kiritimatiellia bacterium]
MNEIVTKTVVLKNKYGMHVRPAGLFAKTAARYRAEVTVEKDGVSVPGKSIMALMTLEAVNGTSLLIHASGEEAQKVVDELEALVERKFDLPDE